MCYKFFHLPVIICYLQMSKTNFSFLIIMSRDCIKCDIFVPGFIYTHLEQDITALQTEPEHTGNKLTQDTHFNLWTTNPSNSW